MVYGRKSAVEQVLRVFITYHLAQVDGEGGLLHCDCLGAADAGVDAIDQSNQRLLARDERTRR